MRQLELCTAQGNYVATVEIPPFPDAGLPEVVMWGNRCFVRSPTRREARDAPPYYFERFAFVSLTESPGLARWTAPEPPPVDQTQRGVSGRAYATAEADLTVTESGQQREYVVLTDAERAKGFVRPVRRTYRHVGRSGPKGSLRDLTEEESTRYAAYGYVKYEAYSEPAGSAVGGFWTQSRLDAAGKGCGSVTSMAQDIAETYARSPSFYGSTFCVGCGTHLPVGASGEFVWEGTDERVGT